MDAATLKKAMQPSPLGDASFENYLPHFNRGMIAASVTTVRRAAAWCAQLGHESLGLRYMEEIASGSAYNGRKDLGNIYPGDGPRFKGRGPIQLTGRYNYGRFSLWCFDKGYTSKKDVFVNDPWSIAKPEWGFLAASWYWTVERPKINSYADAGNFDAITFAINGGYNNNNDRWARYNRCIKLGEAILPSEEFLGLSSQELAEVHRNFQQLGPT